MLCTTCLLCQAKEKSTGRSYLGIETSFGLLEKGCNLSSYTSTNVSRVISHISCYEWICHYDLVDYIVIMQEPRLQIRAGASPSSDPAKLREQINSTRISLAGWQIGEAFTRMNTHMGLTCPLTLHFLFATGAPATVLPLPTCILHQFLPAPSFGMSHNNAVFLPVSFEWVLHNQWRFFPVNPDIPFSTIFLCILKAPSSLEKKSTVHYSQVPENP